MPRAVWSGAISFGLVTIPVKLYNAVSRKSVRFNQLDERSHSRIRYKKVAADTGDEVPNDHIVKAWEASKGNYVVITDEELEAMSPKGGRAVTIEAFVELDEIDPVLWDQAHYAAPDEGFEKAYALLMGALERSGRVAIATFVRSSKQHLAAIRPNHGKLDVCTLVWADEVVSPAEVDGLGGLADVAVSDAELAMADQLIEQLVTSFDHAAFRDTHREELVSMLRAKAAGDESVAATTAAPSEDKVVDLLAALEASVAAAKASRTSAGAATGTPGGAGAATNGSAGASGALDDEAADEPVAATGT